MSPLALAFAVLHIDNSPTALGLVVASWTVPMVGFMLIGGALADRLPRALVLRGCNLIEGAVQLTSAVLVLTGTAQIWHLIVLQFIGGTAVAVSYPAFHGMVPILLPEADRKAAYLLLSQAQSALQVLGPTVAGIIVAVSSPGWALLVDAATFFVAAIFLSLLRLPPNDRPDAGESVLEDFRAGWSFARTLGWVLPVASLSLVFNAVVSGAVGVLGPVRQSHGRCGRLGARTVSGSPRAIWVRLCVVTRDHSSSAAGSPIWFLGDRRTHGGARLRGAGAATLGGLRHQRLRRLPDQSRVEPHCSGESS